MQKDLVCGAEVIEDKSRRFTEYNGRTYPFCSAECKRKFDDHPDYFVHEEARQKIALIDSEQ